MHSRVLPCCDLQPSAADLGRTSRESCIAKCCSETPCTPDQHRASMTCHPQEMIDEADRNGDGQIDEEEFYRIMKKTSLF